VSGHHIIKVAYLVPDLRIGGVERHVTTLMSHLDRERIDPIVICRGRQGELFASLASSGVPAVALERSRRQALACLIDLVRKLQEASPDVVVVRGYNAEVLGRMAAVLARVPRVIVWVHNCGDLLPGGVLRRICDVALDSVTKAYFGVARAQVPYLVRELRYSPGKVRIIHNGVDLSSFTGAVDGDLRAQLGFNEQELVVGILAALRPEKDHKTFLRAASLVSVRNPGARFMIVGDGPRRELLEALAEELGIRDRVTFPSGRNDVAAVLAVMDVFVLSSFTIECFPMALLDQHSSPNDPKGLEPILDARDVLSPFGDARTLAILREYGVDYVVLNQRNERPTSFDYWTLQPAIYGAMKAKFDAHPQWFHLAWQAPKIWVHEVTAAAERGPLPPDVEPERPFARARPRRSPEARRWETVNSCSTARGSSPTSRLRATHSPSRRRGRWRETRHLPRAAIRSSGGSRLRLPGARSMPRRSTSSIASSRSGSTGCAGASGNRACRSPAVYGPDQWRPHVVIEDRSRFAIPRDAAPGRWDGRVRMIRTPQSRRARLPARRRPAQRTGCGPRDDRAECAVHGGEPVTRPGTPIRAGRRTLWHDAGRRPRSGRPAGVGADF
jgi:glycosyltransferase involved in cell wall biosynthesis